MFYILIIQLDLFFTKISFFPVSSFLNPVDALSESSGGTNPQELINAKGSSEEEYDVVVNIEMLKSQVQSVSTDDVEIHYGQDKMIKIVDGDTILVLALL